eukprot:SAG31_NODE_1315_length_8849_cov_809.105943_5_plen_64_part_00
MTDSRSWDLFDAMGRTEGGRPAGGSFSSCAHDGRYLYLMPGLDWSLLGVRAGKVLLSRFCAHY